MVVCHTLIPTLSVDSSKGAKAKAGKKNGSKKTRKQTTEGAEYASDACPVSDANLDTLLETAKSKWLPDSVQDRKQALACIHDATSLFPGSPRAWYMHGFMLQNSGALEEAAAAYGAAVRTHPTESTYAHQLGGCLLMIGAHRAQEALPHLNIAHHLAPSSAPIASDFALAQYYSGRAAEAIKLWKRCEKLDPSNTLQYLYNVVGVHQERSEWKAAFKLLTRMLKLDPLSSETYESLGVVQTTRQRFGAALAAFNTSLALLPRRKHWDANDRMRLQAGVADSLMNLEHFSEALAAYADALAIAAGRDARGLTPAPPPNKKLSSLSSMLYCAAKSCAWGSYESLRLQVADAWHAVLRAGGPGDEVLIEPYAAALFGLDPPLLRDLASYRSRVMQASLRGLEIDMTPPPPPEVHKAPPLPPSPRAPAAAVATGGGRGALRIGYLSADLKTHSVGKLLQAVPALHNARRFRVLCFSLRAAEDDPVQQHLKHECAEFHEVSWMSHKAAAIHINRQHVHVLIDLMGHTRFNRLQVLVLNCLGLGAWRLACRRGWGLCRVVMAMRDEAEQHSSAPQCGGLQCVRGRCGICGDAFALEHKHTLHLVCHI
jgi:tetratricopeptide (TPR) repeat protein